LNPPHAAQARVKPGAQTFPLPRRGNRQDDVSVTRRRIDEEIGVDVKLQALEGTLRHGRIWMSAEQVGAERDKHPHWIRLAIEHRPVDVAGPHPSR